MTDDSTALAVQGRQDVMQLMLDLEANGAIDEVSLTLTDPDMSFERWEALGAFLGSLDRRARWYLGDWLNFGEAVFGEEAAQAVEATVSDRYNLAERVTGLEHGTLMNIRSVCAKVAKERRRKELGFYVHAEVAPLEPQEQTDWLDKAVTEGWTRSQLRDAIKFDKNPPGDEPEPAPSGNGSGDGLTPAERLHVAAQHVITQWQESDDGSYIVPPEPAAQLLTALGEERR